MHPLDNPANDPFSLQLALWKNMLKRRGMRRLDEHRFDRGLPLLEMRGLQMVQPVFSGLIDFVQNKMSRVIALLDEIKTDNTCVLQAGARIFDSRFSKRCDVFWLDSD